MKSDRIEMRDRIAVASSVSDVAKTYWRAMTTLYKFADDMDRISRAIRYEGASPDEFVDYLIEEPSIWEGNLLMYGGASCLWECLIGNGTTGAGNLQFFSSANAAIGVGDSNVAEAATQTDLQATTNKLRVGMDSGYPSHTDGTTSAAATIKFQSTFSTSQANFTWNEWGIFNALSGQRMLQRKVANLGTKASGASWTLQISLTLS